MNWNALDGPELVTLSNGTPHAKSFAVPQGVSSLDLFVAGASGGAGTTSLFVNNGRGGAGAVVTAIVSVAPGDTVTFYGSYAGGSSGNNGAGGVGGAGYLDGGTGGSKLNVSTNPDRAGGGGGGASAVLVNGYPVIIAGGGGGGNFYASNLGDLMVKTNHVAGGSVQITYRVTPLVTAALGIFDGR